MSKTELTLLALLELVEDIFSFFFFLICLGSTLVAVRHWCREFFLRRRDSNIGLEVDSYFFTILGVLLASGVLAIFLVYGLWYLSFFNLDLRKVLGQVYLMVLVPLLCIRFI